MSDFVLYSSVKCFDFLPKFGTGSPIWSHLASKVLNTFLLSCQSHFSMFSFSRLPLLLTLSASIGYGRTSSGFTFNPTELPTCAIDGVVKPND